MGEQELQREAQRLASRVLAASRHSFRMREEGAAAVAWCKDADGRLSEERVQMLVFVLARFWERSALAIERSAPMPVDLPAILAAQDQALGVLDDLPDD